MKHLFTLFVLSLFVIQASLGIFFNEKFGYLVEEDLIYTGEKAAVHGEYADTYISFSIIAILFGILLLVGLIRALHMRNTLWYMLIITTLFSMVGCSIDLYLLTEFNQLFTDGHLSESLIITDSKASLRGAYGLTTTAFNSMTTLLATTSGLYMLFGHNGARVSSHYYAP